MWKNACMQHLPKCLFNASLQHLPKEKSIWNSMQIQQIKWQKGSSTKSTNQMAKGEYRKFGLHMIHIYGFSQTPYQPKNKFLYKSIIKTFFYTLKIMKLSQNILLDWNYHKTKGYYHAREDKKMRFWRIHRWNWK